MPNKPKGTCPICNGTGRKPANLDKDKSYYKYWAGYDAASHTLECNNCGAQYMSCKGTGETYLNHNGIPCVHSYTSKTVSNCYHRYECKHCGDVYHIDSGD